MALFRFQPSKFVKRAAGNFTGEALSHGSVSVALLILNPTENVIAVDAVHAVRLIEKGKLVPIRIVIKRPNPIVTKAN